MDYRYQSSSIFPLLSLVRLLGNNISVAEIGAGGGDSSFHALQECPNISKYYAIEPYCEFIDTITYPQAGQSQNIKYDLMHQDQQKMLFTHRQKFSSYKEKIQLIEKTSKDALKDISDNSLNFIFHDAFPTYEDAIFDFTNWFPKLKNGGIYSGHDYNHPLVFKAVNEFVSSHNIKDKLLTIEFCWFLIK
jgi:hypothetical protein